MLCFSKSTSLDIIAFNCTSENKMHEFLLVSAVAGHQNGVFQTL